MIPDKRMLAACALCALFAVMPASAEVIARVDEAGVYRALSVFPGPGGSVWELPQDAIRFGRGGFLLNPNGHLSGDGTPSFIERVAAPHHPLVVWSRRGANGGPADLAWARFEGQDWGAIRWVDPEYDPWDDIDPSIVEDGTGVVFLAWWKNVNGSGRILFSVLAPGGWTRPFALTPDAVDARYPVLEVVGNRAVSLMYEGDGIVQRLFVVIPDPVTITDDIDPTSAFVLKNLERTRP